MKTLVWTAPAAVLATLGCGPVASPEDGRAHAPVATPAPAADPTAPAASSPPPAPPPPGPPPPPPPITFALHGDTFTLGPDQPFPPCEEPERWLAYVREADLPSAYCARCGVRLECGEGSDPTWRSPWTFATEVADPPNGAWCNEIDYVMAAVGAELGVPVPAGRLARHFGPVRWYHPMPGRTVAELPPAARDNLAWLEGYRTRCDAGAPRVSAADVRIIEGWFEANYDGRAPLPPRLYDNCKPLGAAEFRSLTETEPFLHFTARTPMTASDLAICGDLVGPPGSRQIAVDLGAPLTGEGCDDCEGGQVLQFVLDARGRIIALASFFSG